MNYYLAAALPLFILASANGGTGLRGTDNLEEQADAPYLLPLHRETVPVLQNGKVVSLKTAYSGKISVGGPTAQEFSVVFDTGSGHVVLPASTCEDKTCLVHNRYNITKSPKASPINADGSLVPEDDLCDQATIGYGTGSVTGEFVHESVCVGPAQEKSSKKMCATMNMVMAVEMSAKPFESFKFDGIFGLGLDSLALTSQFSFFSRFSAQSQKKASFGFFLGDSQNGEESEIALGGHNAHRVMGPLSWAPVASTKLGFWNIKVKSVRIGDVELADCKKGGCKAILDTGTSHLGVPSHHMKTVTDLLTKDVASSTDCRSAAAPTLSIDINGFTITLGPEDYMQSAPSSPAASNSDLLAPPPAGSDAVALRDPNAMQHCQPRVMPVNMKKPLGPNLFILGEPVLHRYYTVYDWHKKQVGFGLANSQRNRIGNGATATATAELKVEALDALEGEDEEIYLMQMSVSITLC